MKHLKYFESVDDLEYHKLMIHDVFQDIIDDYGIERGKLGDVDGLFYSITDSRATHWLLRCKGNQIVFMIWDECGYDFIPNDIIRDIKNECLQPHIRRLESMGYTVDTDPKFGTLEIGDKSKMVAKIIRLVINYK